MGLFKASSTAATIFVLAYSCMTRFHPFGKTQVQKKTCTNVIKVGLKEEQVSSDRVSHCIVQTSGELSSIWQDDSILFSTAKSKVSEQVESQVKGITDEGDAEPHLWVTMSRDRKAK